MTRLPLLRIGFILALVITTILSGSLAITFTDHTLPGEQPHTTIDDPLDTRPNAGTIATYEDDLTTDERNIFRQADITDTEAPGSITADYIELDNQYYPVESDTSLPTLYDDIHVLLSFMATLIAVPLWLIALRYVYLHSLIRIGFIPQTLILITIAIPLIAVLVLNPLTAAHIYASTTPVEDPALDNEDVVHLTDLDENENKNAREAMASSVPTPHNDLTYESLSSPSAASTALNNADYIQTDGEHYHVKTGTRTIWVFNALGIALILAILPLLTIVNYLLHDMDPDDITAEF